MFDGWVADGSDSVALHLQENLVPVEGKGAVFFPPTFADLPESYNIDTLSDGTKVVLVDSVGAQANRIEPMFAREPYRALVPQIEISYGEEKKGTAGRLSLLEAPHRLGDAVVRASGLAERVRAAFLELLKSGNATPIAKLAPTSLVFGVWDSRDTMAKVPRLLQSTVRAWNIDRLTRSAQFNPALDYAALDVFSEEDKQKAEGKKESPLAQRGFVHVPATGHGGVVAHGPIRRDLTVNLVALRRLRGDDERALRRYILSLCLLAAREPVDPFFRQGCLLVPDAEQPPSWTLVKRTGERQPLAPPEPAVTVEYARAAAEGFGISGSGEAMVVAFDKKAASKDVTEAKKKGGK